MAQVGLSGTIHPALRECTKLVISGGHFVVAVSTEPVGVADRFLALGAFPLPRGVNDTGRGGDPCRGMRCRTKGRLGDLLHRCNILLSLSQGLLCLLPLRLENLAVKLGLLGLLILGISC